MACLEVTDGRVILINADRQLSAHRWVADSTAGAFTFGTAEPQMTYAVEAELLPPRWGLLGRQPGDTNVFYPGFWSLGVVRAGLP